MNRWIKIFVGALALGTSFAWSRPMEMPGRENVRDLVARADLVFRGRVERAKENKQRPKESSAEIVVEKVYKGTGPRGKIEIIYDSSDIECVRPIPNERSLFFVRYTEGKARLLDCQHGKLKGVLRDGKSAAGESPEKVLGNDLRQALKSGDRDEVLAAIPQLVGLGRRDIISDLKSLLPQGDSELKFTAHWALIQLGDYSGLEALASEFKKDTPVSVFLHWNISSAIININDKQAVAPVLTLTRSENPMLVKAGAEALRNIKSKTTVFRLIELLDYPDADVKYHALMTLVDIEEEVMPQAPARETFNRGPERYLGVWKDWWEKRGKRKYSK